MSAALKALMRGSEDKLYVDDVFIVNVRTGTSASGAITNGPNLLVSGGMVHTKWRSGTNAAGHFVTTNLIGLTNYLLTNSAVNKTDNSAANRITSFNTDGLSFGGNTETNLSGNLYVDWVFRNAPNFYGHQVVVKSTGSNQTASFPELTTLGMVRVKRTDDTGSWYIWHRSLSAGKLLIGETTAAEATLGHITVSGTTVTLVNGVIADGTYLVEAFGHDTTTDGIIQCGSYTGNGSATGPDINLGWEPQFLIVKPSSIADTWLMLDTMRGITVGGNDPNLSANSSAAEQTSNQWLKVTATGFSPESSNGQVNQNAATYIYLAIRRPNKPPTSGTQVYAGQLQAPTGSSFKIAASSGFPVDLLLSKRVGSVGSNFLNARLLGNAYYETNTTAAEGAYAYGWDSMAGVTAVWDSSPSTVSWAFRRAPGVFDQVCYTGTGVAKTEAHNLGVVPELMIVKIKNLALGWLVYAAPIGNNKYLQLNQTAATGADSGGLLWNLTTPTSSAFSLGSGDTNNSTYTYTAYLFATKPGISYVGSYTGNGGSADSAGTSQTINCGFTTGARFVMIKCTSHTSDWVVIDTARGLVAGNDPTLSLNTTAAEVTGQDLLDPANEGFVVNQLGSAAGTSANFNVTGRTYLVLAFA